MVRMLSEAGRLPLRAASAVAAAAAAAAPPPPHTPRVAGLDERPQQRRGRRGEEEEKAAAAEEVAVFVVSLLRAPEAAAPAVVVGGGCEGARLPARPPGPRGRGGGGCEDDDVRGDCLPRRRLLRARRGRILRSCHLLFLPGAGGAVHVGSRRLGGRRGAGAGAVRRGLSGSLSAAAVRPRLGRPLPEDLHHCAQ